MRDSFELVHVKNSNKRNWTIKGGKHAFLGSRKLQDKACKKAVKQNIATGVRLDIIKPGSSQKFIAGWGKAMQFGPERAIAWYTSRNDMTDGNGTKTSTFAAEGAAAVREH